MIAIDGIVSGAALSSPDVIRPALQIIKTAPGKVNWRQAVSQ